MYFNVALSGINTSERYQKVSNYLLNLGSFSKGCVMLLLAVFKFQNYLFTYYSILKSSNFVITKVSLNNVITN